jgi:hypothetical protein
MVSALTRVKRSLMRNASLVGSRRPLPVTSIVPLKIRSLDDQCLVLPPAPGLAHVVPHRGNAGRPSSGMTCASWISRTGCLVPAPGRSGFHVVDGRRDRPQHSPSADPMNRPLPGAAQSRPLRRMTLALGRHRSKPPFGGSTMSDAWRCGVSRSSQ